VIPKTIRTWSIESDIAKQLGDWVAQARLPLGYSVQFGIWMVMSLNPDQRHMLMNLMDDRKEVQLNVTVKPRRPTAEPKKS